MKEHEKATEIILNFLRYADSWQTAKRCAVVAVTEVINEIMDIDGMNLAGSDLTGLIEYWHEVREQLFKM